MPVTILTTLILWSSLLAPASGIEPSGPKKCDRLALTAADDQAIPSIGSRPVSAPGAWTLPVADINEEETGDGDPEGLASAVGWLPPRLFADSTISSIRRDRAVVRPSTRSPILRC